MIFFPIVKIPLAFRDAVANPSRLALGILFAEAARDGQAQISLKGKIRVIMLPGKLCRKLLKYAEKQKIASGEIFLTKSGKG